MKSIDAVMKAEEMLAIYGVSTPAKAIAKYENSLSAQIFTINFVGLMQKMFGELDEAVNVRHSAKFKTSEEKARFAAMLYANDYCIDSVTVVEKEKYYVDFHHRSPKLDDILISSRVAWLVSLIEDLNGRYCNWEVDVDPVKKKIIPANARHTDNITGLLWHRYEEAIWDYPDAVTELYTPKANFQYRTNKLTGVNYSLLDQVDVDEIMRKLRLGQGCIGLDRLHHFDDRHLSEVSEILDRRMYIYDISEIGFGYLALAQDRMGASALALELGVHSINLGEDLNGICSANDASRDLSFSFALKSHKEKLRRDLAAQLPKGKKSTARKPKL
jgi:hypothetical protein